MNHDCIGNSITSFIGDMMIVRAARDIQVDNEITIRYEAQSLMDTKEDVNKKFNKFEFACLCAWCEDIRHMPKPIWDKREELPSAMGLVASVKQSIDAYLTNGDRVLTAAQVLYARPAIEVPRVLLHYPQFILVRRAMDNDKFKQAVLFVDKALAHLGFVVSGADGTQTDFTVVRWGYMTEMVVASFICARSAFMKLLLWKKAQQAEECAKIAYRIMVGEDASFDPDQIDIGDFSK